MKKNNRKGFTLVELLAVIIVLALILVFAIPAVLDTSTRAQKKSFATYARRVLTLAQEYVEAQKLDGDVDNMAFKNETGSGFSLGTNDNEYTACIEYTTDGTYKIYMFNKTYYVGTVTGTKSGATEAQLKDSDNVNNISDLDGNLSLTVDGATCTANVGR